MAEVVNSFFYEMGQVSIVLKVFRELDMMDERCTYRAVDLWRELIAIVEAFTKGFHLIASTSQTDDVFSTVMLEIEHESFLCFFVCYTHSQDAGYASILA